MPVKDHLIQIDFHPITVALNFSSVYNPILG